MAIKAVIWPEGLGQEETSTYKVQISNIPKRSKNKILKEMRDWQQAGDGQNFKNSELIFLFRKEFKDQKAMLEWASSVSYPVCRVNRSGVEVEIKKKGTNARKRTTRKRP
jgi:hypothetical protein